MTPTGRLRRKSKVLDSLLETCANGRRIDEGSSVNRGITHEN